MVSYAAMLILVLETQKLLCNGAVSFTTRLRGRRKRIKTIDLFKPKIVTPSES